MRCDLGLTHERVKPWHSLCESRSRTSLEMGMTSRNVGSKRLDTDDADVPAELGRREAQDRPKGTGRAGQAESPVDSMHVDAPKQQDHERGHKRRDHT